jgi:hypothetical protein
MARAMIHPRTRSIIPLHIPKAAGQTVHTKLDRILGDAAMSPIRLHMQIKMAADQFPNWFSFYPRPFEWQSSGPSDNSGYGLTNWAILARGLVPILQKLEPFGAAGRLHIGCSGLSV